MSKSSELKHSFLKELLDEQVNVSIFLVNGIKLHGTLDGFDDEVILLKNTLTQMIFKHAISTVVPSRLSPATIKP